MMTNQTINLAERAMETYLEYRWWAFPCLVDGKETIVRSLRGPTFPSPEWRAWGNRQMYFGLASRVAADGSGEGSKIVTSEEIDNLSGSAMDETIAEAMEPKPTKPAIFNGTRSRDGWWITGGGGAWWIPNGPLDGIIACDLLRCLYEWGCDVQIEMTHPSPGGDAFMASADLPGATSNSEAVTAFAPTLALCIARLFLRVHAQWKTGGSHV